MEFTTDPDSRQEKDVGETERALQDYTPVDTGVRVLLNAQCQILPALDDKDLLIASFCEV
jgi:hypothetical protein